MNEIILILLLAAVCIVNSQTTPAVNKQISTKSPGPTTPGARDKGSRPWGFSRRRQPRIHYDNYYYDYYGMSGGCSCTPFRCRGRFAFRGRCRTYRLERPGFRCCYFGFRREFDDYDFDLYD